MLRTIAALLITILTGVALIGEAPRVSKLGQLDLAAAATKPKLTVKASAKHLAPGVTKKLRIKVSNPLRYRIKVTSVSVTVKNASRKCRASNLRAIVRKRPFVVRAHRGAVSRKVAKVRMITNAKNACQAARFPLKVTVKAVKG